MSRHIVWMYDKCIWIVPVELFWKADLEWYLTTKGFSVQYRKAISVWSLILFFNYWYYYQCLICDSEHLETSCNSQYQLKLKGQIKAIVIIFKTSSECQSVWSWIMYIVYCIWWILIFNFWDFILENWG